MIYVSKARPFTDAVKRKRREGMRYQDLEQGCDRARSTAWFNTLINATNPWAVNPPGAGSFPGLCKLLGVDEQVLKHYIAEEWYDVKSRTTSSRVTALASQLDKLSEERATLIAKLIAELEGGSPQLSVRSVA